VSSPSRGVQACLAACVGVAALAGIAVVVSRSGASSTASAIVASVYDGDTLTLTNGERVRLLQIDTPELGSGECYSRAARTALLHLAPVASRVVLEADPALDRIDRYGRILRSIERAGVNVNVELVRRGAAAPYFYRGERGRHATALLAAALAARAEKRGLWRACPGTRLDPDHAVETGARAGSGCRCV
jgi:endonuclease YncB( thermonuclease family)